MIIGQQIVYVEHLKRWYSYFPANNIRVIQSERLYERAEEVFFELIEFLELPRDQIKRPLQFPVINEGTRKSEWLMGVLLAIDYLW